MEEVIEKKKRQPSKYNLFVKEHILNNTTGCPAKDRLKQAGVAWKEFKDSQVEA